jgi:sec-independent protein translocase protein TatA
MPSWLGPWEIVIVVVVILLVFGGRLIPRIGSSLGRSILGLRKGLKEGQEEFQTAIKDDEAKAPAQSESKSDSAAE